MGVTVILCSFKLVLEGKAGTETSESSFRVFKKDAEPTTLRPLNRGEMGYLS